MVGGLTLTPVLGNVASANKVAIQDKVLVSELYAADAGVEDALWAIHAGVSDLPGEEDSAWSYTIDGSINGRAVNVSVSYISDSTFMVKSTAVSLDGSSTVITSYVNTEEVYADLFSNALASEGNIRMHKDSVVNGDIYYGGTFEGYNKITHNGDVVDPGTLEFPTDAEDLAFAQEFKDEAMAGTIINSDLNISTDFTFAGPTYINGDLFVKKDVTLTLNGTIFVEGSIKANKDFTITGTGNIIAVGDIAVCKLSDYGTDGASVIMSLTGDIDFRKEAEIEALIYAPNGSVFFNKEATIIGAVVASDIEAKKQGKITYIAGETEKPGEGYETGIITWDIARP